MIEYLIILNDHLSIDTLKAASASGEFFRCGSLQKGFLEWKVNKKKNKLKAY